MCALISAKYDCIFRPRLTNLIEN